MIPQNDERIIVKFLEWDSTFFNKKIGILNLNKNTSIIDIHKVCEEFELVYIFLNESDPFLSEFNNLFHIENVIFQKEISSTNRINDHNIKPIPKNFEQEVLELAYSAGGFSRFRMDPGFSESEFRSLYDHWLNKSFNEDRNEIIGYFVENRIAAFLSLSFTTGDKLKIELLSVSSDFQNQGIGRKLLEFTENFALEKKCKIIEVVTQLENQAAVNFYLHNNFNIIQSYKIVHFWKTT